MFVAYFSRHDPALLERRLRIKDSRREQRLFQILWAPLWIVTLVLPGLDYRFGWSKRILGGPPLWLVIAALAIVMVAWLLVFEVLRVNSFASAVVQVESLQKVITTGPYSVVRHPMYTGFVIMILATPIGLGSYVALIPAIPLIIPVIILRLFDEERALRQELPGYAEYCKRVRFRLVPWVF